MKPALPSLLVLSILASAIPAKDWPGWRGPTGQGHYDGKDLPLTWGGKEQENILWKVPVPGTQDKTSPSQQDQNQSSPIVVRGRVFVTASYWPMETEPKGFPEHHVVCYRADDGKQKWDVAIKPGPWQLSDLRGGYTAPTPASDGERVYVLFGSSVLAALDLDGKLLWRQEIKPFDFDVCIGASPVVHGETVLVMCDQVSNASRLLAFDRKTGEVKWRQPRPKVGFGHSTPILARVGERTQLLVAASSALQGLDPDTGKVLWWCDAPGDTVSPVLGGGLVYIDSGRGGGPGVAVDPTGEGDVTKTHLKWQIQTVPEGFSSPIIMGEHLFRLNNPGVLKCWKLATGEEVFAERLQGVNPAVSPIVTADGRIYAASAGRSYVLKAGPKPEIIGGGDLNDGSNAAPAAADGKLYLKGSQFLYCIGVKK
jgi:outer membrane protein assembly factor BamB